MGEIKELEVLVRIVEAGTISKASGSAGHGKISGQWSSGTAGETSGCSPA